MTHWTKATFKMPHKHAMTWSACVAVALLWGSTVHAQELDEETRAARVEFGDRCTAVKRKVVAYADEGGLTEVLRHLVRLELDDPKAATKRFKELKFNCIEKGREWDLLSAGPAEDGTTVFFDHGVEQLVSFIWTGKRPTPIEGSLFGGEATEGVDAVQLVGVRKVKLDGGRVRNVYVVAVLRLPEAK